MNTNELRESFLSFFEQQKHARVPSSPLIPGNDPTLLFTNAGMVQFKDVFLGNETRAYSRATSCQRCVRAGGKHNDLENVGHTARHHTFFEMLGNFSFGDYFKKEAIQFAWTYLTTVLKLPPEKLWITVFTDDKESENIWLKDIGVDPKRFSRLGEKSNFWTMGDTGPCGPCTEVFYDHGDKVPGGPPGTPEEDGDRYVEIWNLVFMQYDRDKNGKLTPLPKPSVDTGMGLERIAAVMQGVQSNYDIDLFKALRQAVVKCTGTTQTESPSVRVIADHIRSCTFLIADGVRPSNEGRGYVLRRIIRRAIRHGHTLGKTTPFFSELVAPLIEQMGQAYPELKKAQPIAEKVLKDEEIQFSRTLEQGLSLLQTELQQLKNKMIPGDLIFRLYDTYGFPLDLTADLAREQCLELDIAGFEAAMAKQREQSQASRHFATDYKKTLSVTSETDFTGYHALTGMAKILHIFVNGAAVDSLNSDSDAMIVLDKTPFYAESGGQVGDTGLIQTAAATFEVLDTTKLQQTYLHHGKLQQGVLHVGDTVTATVDAEKRQATVLNHSATHLLHAALRQILGEHVVQKGSLVAPTRLRFDFAHTTPLTQSQIHAVEDLVNTHIRLDASAHVDVMNTQEAMKSGAMALFDEKYGDTVRVLKLGKDNFSVELCGGTHVARTGEIGLFKIISETGIAAGVRRIEAVTGKNALDAIADMETLLQSIANNLKCDRAAILTKMAQSAEQTKMLEKTAEQLRQELASFIGQQFAEKAITVDDFKVIGAQLEKGDLPLLRAVGDFLRTHLKQTVICLVLVEGERAHLVTGVTNDLTHRFHAGNNARYFATQLGGSGGGKADTAQGGFKSSAPFMELLQTLPEWVVTTPSLPQAQK